MNLEDYKKILETKLSEKRFYHSVCTMEMCEKLAKHYNIDVEEARLVGLMHDIAKEIPSDEKISYAKENNLPIDEIELAFPTLLHAKIGAHMCKTMFNFSDKMCNAILLHTTGGKNMDMLSKILFVADGIGVDRTWEDVDIVRDLAFKDLDASVLYMLNLTITECIEKNRAIHTDTILARNYLLLNS